MSGQSSIVSSTTYPKSATNGLEDFLECVQILRDVHNPPPVQVPEITSSDSGVRSDVWSRPRSPSVWSTATWDLNLDVGRLQDLDEFEAAEWNEAVVDVEHNAAEAEAEAEMGLVDDVEEGVERCEPERV